MTSAEAEGALEKSSKSDVLCIGIDLGTSQSSIATNTQIRRTVSSVVGWPKDLIS